MINHGMNQSTRQTASMPDLCQGKKYQNKEVDVKLVYSLDSCTGTINYQGALCNTNEVFLNLLFGCRLVLSCYHSPAWETSKIKSWVRHRLDVKIGNQ